MILYQKRELISILDKYDLLENSELADIIETLGIKKGDGEREDIEVVNREGEFG